MSCTCQRCGKKYKVDLIIPDELWEIIKPEGKSHGVGLLCGSCIMEGIERLDYYVKYDLGNNMNQEELHERIQCAIDNLNQSLAAKSSAVILSEEYRLDQQQRECYEMQRDLLLALLREKNQYAHLFMRWLPCAKGKGEKL